MESAGLSTIFAAPSTEIPFSVYAGLSLFAIIGAVVFLAAAIMLAVRVVSLTFLMVLAPLGFAGMALPMFQGMASRWWNALIKQAFFAPVMLLMLFVSLKIADSFGTVGGNGLAGALSQPNVSTMGIFFVFTIVIGFLVASLVVAKNMGAMGASFAINAGTKFVRTPLGFAGSLLGRNTIGRAGANTQKLYEGAVGRSPALRKTLVLTGIDDAITNSLDKAKKAKFGGSSSYADRTKHTEERNDHLEHAGHKAHQSAELEDALATGSDQEVAALLQQMSMSDIEQTKYVKAGADGIDRLAQNLSPEKFEQLMNNKDLDAGKKDRLREGRFTNLAADITATAGFAAAPGTPDRVRAEQAQRSIRQWSVKDLEQLAKADPAQFQNLVTAQNASGDNVISDDQSEALAKSNTLTTIQQQQVKTNPRSSRINTLFDNGRVPTAAEIASAQALIGNIGSAKNVAKLSSAVLTHPTIANSLTGPQLGAIAAEDKLNAAQQQALASVVQARAAVDPSIQAYLSKNQVVDAYFTP
jgi:hypothetical protein